MLPTSGLVIVTLMTSSFHIFTGGGWRLLRRFSARSAAVSRAGIGGVFGGGETGEGKGGSGRRAITRQKLALALRIASTASSWLRRVRSMPSACFEKWNVKRKNCVSRKLSLFGIHACMHASMHTHTHARTHACTHAHVFARAHTQ